MLYFNYKGRFFANMFQLIMRKNKSELPDEIVDNLMKIHSIHNDKYAPMVMQLVTLGMIITVSL